MYVYRDDIEIAASPEVVRERVSHLLHWILIGVPSMFGPSNNHACCGFLETQQLLNSNPLPRLPPNTELPQRWVLQIHHPQNPKQVSHRSG